MKTPRDYSEEHVAKMFANMTLLEEAEYDVLTPVDEDEEII